MGLLFNTNFHKGSYISRQGYVGTNTNGSFARTTAGLAWDSSATARIDYDTVSLGTTHTFVINYTRSTSGVAIFFTDTAEADGVLFLNSTDLRYRAGGHNISFSGSGDTLNSFNQLIITRSGTAVNCYLNNSLYDAEQTLGGDVAFDLDLIGHATTSLVGYLANIEVHDNIFTSQERSNAYRDFLAAAPKITEKLPGSLPEMKATSPNDPNLLVAYNCVPANGSLVDISNNEVPATLSGGIITTKDGISLDGINDFVSVNITLTPAGTVKTIAFRIKLATTTEMIYEGQSNDIIILANAGTLTASDYDTIYVDGVEAATVVAGQWHNVVITSSTVVDNNTPSIGYNSGTFNYGKFELEDFMVSSEEWDLTKVQKYHNSFADVVKLAEDFRWDPVSSNLPRAWFTDSGTFITSEDATGKYISCSATGTASISGVDLAQYVDNGFIKEIDGDLTADAGDTVDNASSVAYANDKLTLTMNTGEKVRNIIITEAAEA